MISEKHKLRFWLFGGIEDSERLGSFQSRVPGSVNIVGKLNLDEELALMSRLDLMIAMDSSNMHMAALVGNKSNLHLGRNRSVKRIWRMDAT